MTNPHNQVFNMQYPPQPMYQNYPQMMSIPTQPQYPIQPQIMIQPVYYPPTNMNPHMQYSSMPFQNISNSSNSFKSNNNLSLKTTNDSNSFMNQNRYTGRLKFYNQDQQFGFIIKTDTLEDIFFHLTDMEAFGITAKKLVEEKNLFFSFEELEYMGNYN